jgi:hypothetical protein
MKAQKHWIRYALVILGMLALSLLAACQEDATPTVYINPSPDPLQTTVAALADENARLSTQVAGLAETLQNQPSPTPTIEITDTPTPTLTPTPGPTISVPEDLLTVTHESAPGYVFIIDPETWTVGSTTAPADDFLIYTDANDCTVNIAPGTPPSDLLQYYPQIIGRRSWLIEGYEENTFYLHQDLRLELSITENEDCIAAQEGVLEELLTQEEFEGAPISDVAVRPTQRPTPEEFTCEETLPSRLAIGDRVLITAGFLWLRSEANVDEATEVKLYQQYAPAEITVTSGPICADNFVFWEVTVAEFGETGETYTGWMAEAGADQYFLDIWYLGW